MIEYHILKTGRFFADGGAMFGAIPKRYWTRKYPSDDKNRCILAMNCLLARLGNRVILFDTGVGNKELSKLAYYNFHDRRDLRDLIAQQGFCPEQVTDVVLSHLHFDHCGGCTYRDMDGNVAISFPSAKHWVGEKQWQNFLHHSDLEKDSYRQEDIMPVYEAGLIQRIDSDFELSENFHLKLFDGHTPGQIVSLITTGSEQRLLFPGDVIPTKAHLSAEWISAYDIEPLKSLAAKKILKEWINKKTVVVFYHDISSH